KNPNSTLNNPTVVTIIMSSTDRMAKARPGLTVSWNAPKRVFTPTEFAGIDVNPKSSVKSVATIPMQATTPRTSRTGLIGRFSAIIGLDISEHLLTRISRREQAFSSRNDSFVPARLSLGEGGSSQASSTAAQTVAP